MYFPRAVCKRNIYKKKKKWYTTIVMYMWLGRASGAGISMPNAVRYFNVKGTQRHLPVQSAQPALFMVVFLIKYSWKCFLLLNNDLLVGSLFFAPIYTSWRLLFEVYTCCLAHAPNRNKAMEGKLPVSAVYVTEKVRLDANLDGSIRPHVI